MVTHRDECRCVVRRQGVDSVGHQELVQNTTMHGQKVVKRVAMNGQN